ncbi:acetyltransferase [Methanobrevibacter arboriphilus JCM 13429 = DSM 1125]|uniref:Acetyltransferase n=2 Tax=Methanobrevibacter arboriphilus TaxID=39441 RepID=A0A1V6N3Y8_METAZ|nr:acetyltransferase [Methanobrevibacter arboriphilus JCM 13429 = DSM 1125]
MYYNINFFYFSANFLSFIKGADCIFDKLNYFKSFIFLNMNIFSSKTEDLSSKNTRIFKYDNLRGLGILLVVFFHLLNSFFNFPIYKSIGQLIVIIAMPIIFFVSGYFSKVDENTQIKAFSGILIPYFLFCTLWIIFTFIVFGWDLPKTPYLLPSAGLWYLLTLFLMRSFLPVFVRIKHIFWIMIAGSLLIGLISYSSNFLSIFKTVYYLPLFMLGYYFKNSEYYLSELDSRISSVFLKVRNFIVSNKIITFVFLILFLIALSFIFADFPKNFFSFDISYDDLGIGDKLGMFLRLITIAASIIVAILLNYLMPNKEMFLTKIGMNSLAVYVLHFYFTRSLKTFFLGSSLGDIVSNNPYLAIIYVIIATLVITFILSRDFVTKSINKVINLFVKLLVKTS